VLACSLDGLGGSTCRKLTPTCRGCAWALCVSRAAVAVIARLMELRSVFNFTNNDFLQLAGVVRRSRAEVRGGLAAVGALLFREDKKAKFQVPNTISDRLGRGTHTASLRCARCTTWGARQHASPSCTLLAAPYA
jgi:hypothetical protein